MTLWPGTQTPPRHPAPPGRPNPAGITPGSASGTLRARLVLVYGTNEGVFIYNGKPAKGNPPIVSATSGTTDPFGNTVVPGLDVTAGKITGAFIETGTSGARVTLDDTGTLDVYNSSGTLVMALSASAETLTVGPSGQVQVQLSSTAGYGELIFPMTGISLDHAGYMVGAKKAGTNGNYAALGINGPALNTAGHTDYIDLAFNSSDSVSSANLDFIYFDANGTVHEQAVLDYTGFQVLAGLVKGIHPGTGTSPTNAAAEEVWQNMSLGSTWTTISGYHYPQYRINGNGNVELRGAVSGSSISGNTTITTLLDGYYSTSYQFQTPVTVISGAGAPTAGQTFRLLLNTSGVLAIEGIATAGAYELALDGIMFPIVP